MSADTISVCGKCHSEFVYDDQREQDGTGYVYYWCPNHPEVRGFGYDGGKIDLEAMRLLTPDRDNNFEIFPNCDIEGES